MRHIEFSRFVDKSHPAAKIASQDVATRFHKQKVADLIAEVVDGRSRIAVTDEKGGFKGIVKSLDVLDFLGGGPKYEKFLAGRLHTPIDRIMETDVETVTPKHTVSDVLEAMKKRNLDSCPLLVGKEFSALVTEASFVRRLSGRTGIKVMDVMVHRPMVAKDHQTVTDVASIMARTKYRRLPVVSKGIMLGMVTPADIISHLRSKNAMHDLKAQTLPVTEVMNRNIATVSQNDDVEAAIAKMKSGYSGLPVVEENELVGIITERDVLELLR